MSLAKERKKKRGGGGMPRSTVMNSLFENDDFALQFNWVQKKKKKKKFLNEINYMFITLNYTANCFYSYMFITLSYTANC